MSQPSISELFQQWAQGASFMDLQRSTGLNYDFIRLSIQNEPGYAEAKAVRKKTHRPQDNPIRPTKLLVDKKGPSQNERRLKKIERAKILFDQYMEGATLQEIATEHNVSRQRIEQVLRILPEYREFRLAATGKSFNIESLMPRWLRGHSYEDLAKGTGLSRAMIKRLFMGHPRYAELNAKRPRYYEAAKVQAMVDFYNEGHTLREVMEKFSYSIPPSGSLNAVWPLLSRHPDYQPRPAGWAGIKRKR